MVKKLAAFGLTGLWVALALTASGCSFNDEPRPRLGSYATSTLGTYFIDLTTLGRHNYDNCLSEGNGIVYTCQGGHIDIAHLRIAADYVRYLTGKTRKSLLKTDRKLTFKPNVDPSRYYVTLQYPEDWNRLPDPERERIADEVSLELAGHFTFMMVTWHEVMTFAGYKSMGFVSETPSAFSWEDNYSNLLGIRLATAALQDLNDDYNTAMTRLLKAEMESLGIQPATTAKAAAEKMRGIWFEGNIFVTMKVRHIDIGLDDEMVSPLLATDVCPDTQPRPYPTPLLKSLTKYGFKMTLQVEPRELEKGQILKVVCPDGDCMYVSLPQDLPIILDDIEKQTAKAGCKIVK